METLKPGVFILPPPRNPQQNINPIEKQSSMEKIPDKISELIETSKNILYHLETQIPKSSILDTTPTHDTVKKPQPITRTSLPQLTPPPLPTIQPFLDHSNSVVNEITSQEYTKSQLQRGIASTTKKAKEAITAFTNIATNLLPTKREPKTKEQLIEEAKQQYETLYTQSEPNIIVMEDHPAIRAINEKSLQDEIALTTKDLTEFDKKIKEELENIKKENILTKQKSPTKTTKIKIERDPITKEPIIVIIPEETKTPQNMKLPQ